MPSILLIGGAGYIGSHMALALAEAANKVVIFDNLSRGHSDAVGSALLVVGDLRSLEDLERGFVAQHIDLVMHFAALAYVGESIADPQLYYENNVVGTINLLGAMRRHGVRRLVFSSTCATYGEPDFVPMDELHPQRPVNPYGRSKLMSEQALADYGAAYGIQSVSLRYFNAAGCDAKGRAGHRHDPETRLIPLVLGEALRLQRGGDPEQTSLRVFGSDFATADGSCVRDYIHVSDLCQAHLLAANRLLSGDVSGAEAYNLAIGKGFSVLEVIEACRQVTGQPIRYRMEARREGDPATLIGDASRAIRILDWKPRYTDLKEIIATSWAWMNRLVPP